MEIDYVQEETLVCDSMIPSCRSQIRTGGLTSLWWWQAAAQVSKAAHICLLHPLPVVMPVMGLHPVAAC